MTHIINVDNDPGFLAGEMVGPFAKQFGEDHILVAHHFLDNHEQAAKAMKDVWLYLGFVGDMPEMLPQKFFVKQLAMMHDMMDMEQRAVREFMVGM